MRPGELPQVCPVPKVMACGGGEGGRSLERVGPQLVASVLCVRGATDAQRDLAMHPNSSGSIPTLAPCQVPTAPGGTRHGHAGRGLAARHAAPGAAAAAAAQLRAGLHTARPGAHHVLVAAGHQVAVAHDGAAAAVPVGRGRGARGQPGRGSVAGGGGIAVVDGLGNAADVAVVVRVGAAGRRGGSRGWAGGDGQVMQLGSWAAGQKGSASRGRGGNHSSGSRLAVWQCPLASDTTGQASQNTLPEHMPCLCRVFTHLLKLWPISCSTAMTSHTTADGLLPCRMAAAAVAVRCE